MRYRYLSSFDRSFRDLPPDAQAAVREALNALFRLFEGGIKPEGLGLRKLKGSFWEIRCGLRIRILFTLERDAATFVLVGDHDAIRGV